MHCLADALGGMQGKHGVQRFFAVSLHLLNIVENIDGNNNADGGVVNAYKNINNAGGDVLKDTVNAGQNLRFDPVAEHIADIADGAGGVFLNLRIVFEHLFHPVDTLRDIRRAVHNDGLDAVIKLRQDEINQSPNNGDHGNLGQPHRKAAGTL